jgi:capsular exopolysaccharide synthesis family protein
MTPHDAGRHEPAGKLPRHRPDTNPVAGRIDPAVPQPGRTAPAAPPPALTAAPTFGALLKALRRRWLTAAVLGVLLGGTAAGLTWWLMTPKYTAFAQFKVSSVEDKIGPGDGKAAATQASQTTFLRTTAAQLRSRQLLAAVLGKDEVKRLALDASHNNDAEGWLEEALKVEFPDPGEIVTVTLDDGDPNVALTVMKHLVAQYMDAFVYAEGNSKADKLDKLEKIYNIRKTDLQQKRQNFAIEAGKAGASVGTSDPNVLDQQQKALLENLHEARQQRNQWNLELVKASASLKALKDRVEVVKETPVTDADVNQALKADPDPAAKDALLRLPALQEFIKEWEDKSSNLREPSYVEAKKRVARLQQILDTRRAELREELKARMTAGTGANNQAERELAKKQLEEGVASLTAQLDKLDKSIKDMEEKANKIGGWTTDLTAMRQEIDSDAKFLDELDAKRSQMKVEMEAAPRVSKFQDADFQKRDLKKQILATAAAPAGVLFLVCMGVAWLDVRQRRVRSAGDVAAGLGIRVVGAVPGVPHLERRLVGPSGEPEAEDCPALESFDAIRTLLLRGDGGPAPRVLLVTSAAAGEGKTTLAAHLASSLARAGRKTLLIDGDLRRPSVHQLFEAPAQPGFSEVLLGEVEAAEGVQATGQDGLAVMPAGQWDREVLQALARGGLEGLFEKLREEFDFLVVDSHPVLSATDSLLLAQHADAAVLSVLRDVSQAPRVYAASQKLAELGVRVLGAVVNGADPNEVVAAPAAAPARKAAAG